MHSTERLSDDDISPLHKQTLPLIISPNGKPATGIQKASQSEAIPTQLISAPHPTGRSCIGPSLIGKVYQTAHRRGLKTTDVMLEEEVNMDKTYLASLPTGATLLVGAKAKISRRKLIMPAPSSVETAAASSKHVRPTPPLKRAPH